MSWIDDTTEICNGCGKVIMPEDDSSDGLCYYCTPEENDIDYDDSDLECNHE